MYIITKRFFNHTKLVFLLFLYLTVLVFELNLNNNEFTFLGNFFDLQIVSFLYYLISAFEFNSELIQYNINETIISSKNGYIRETFHNIILVIISLIISVTIFLFFLYINSTSENGTNISLCIQAAKAIGIHYTLVSFFAIILGMIFSNVRNKSYGWVLLICVFSFFSRIFITIFNEITKGNQYLNHIFSIFSIINRDYVNLDNFYFISVESVDFQRICFLIFISISIYIYIIFNKKIYFFISTCLALLFLFLYLIPAGARYRGDYWDSISEMSTYYTNLFESKKNSDIGRQYCESDFNIVSIKGELTPSRVLQAKLDVEINHMNVNQCKFTLFHGYRIKQITNSKGEPLDFTQSIDHVLVYNSKNNNHFIFEYEGYSRENVATSQAVYLPGYFPYIPFAGWKDIFPEPIILSDGKKLIVEEYNLQGNLQVCYYELKINTTLNICTNLKKCNNYYCGNSEGVTVIASNNMNIKKIKNAVIYYNIYDKIFSKSNFNKTISDFENCIKKIRPNNRIAIFTYMINPAQTGHYIANDHAIVNDADELYEHLTYYNKYGKTKDYHNNLDEIVKEAETQIQTDK